MTYISIISIQKSRNLIYRLEIVATLKFRQFGLKCPITPPFRDFWRGLATINWK